VADAVHEFGGLFVLDCVASGAAWVDMRKVGVDVLISAPQKGWSASPCAALIMLSTRALAKLASTTSSSFACDLKKWHSIMQAYVNGSHAYHATLPTDGLVQFHAAMMATKEMGFELLRERQWQLGQQVRELLARYGYRSVAAADFAAPGVVVSYTNDEQLHSGRKFIEQGLQAAAGVPLMCDEPVSYKTFRLGLFGLDKLNDVDAAVSRLEKALSAM
jgi:aspartate aminotransferase-like enzyme